MPKNTNLLIRKFIHFSTGLLILALSYLFEKNILLLLFIAGASFSFLTFNYRKFYFLHKASYSSLGTLFYPVGVISSFLILYDQPVYYFRAALMVLTISDTMAYFAGQFIKFNGSFRILYDSKSLLGVLAFSITTLLILYLYLPKALAGNFYYILLVVVLSVNLEVISFKGSDNFSIPAGLSLFFVLSEKYAFNFPYLLGVIVILASGSYLLYKWNILTRTGSLSAYILGVYFLSLPDLIWIIPVLFFFLSSVLFTKLHSRISKRSISSNKRNAWQVLANIIWAVISSAIFLISHNEIFIYFFISVLAAVTADTWASELGPLLNKRSFSVADLKMHPAGITGGISPGGTMAALVASITISIISLYIFFGEFQIKTVVLLSLSGFLACFTDTFLGAFAEEKLLKHLWKEKYKNKFEHYQDIKPGLKNANYKYLEMDLVKSKNGGPSPNDIVNISGSATAPMFFILLSILF